VKLNRTVAGLSISVALGLSAAAVVTRWSGPPDFATADSGSGRRSAQSSSSTADNGYRFEVNRGQFDERIQYLARGKRYGLFLSRDGATLSLRGPDAAPSVLTMRLQGGRDLTPEGVGKLPTRNNYFIGADPARWRTDVPSYRRVRYSGVLPGVDLEYYGTDERQAEYDLVVAPGTSPAGLTVVFGGTDGIRLDTDGSARLKLAGGGEIRKPPPVAYQTDDRGRRIIIAARYEKRGADRLGFALGAYDTRRRLVIDPVFAYSTLLGGASSDRAQAVAVDASGNAYVVGHTTSATFPVLAPFQGTNKNIAGGNVFVTKLGPSGAPSPVYSTYLGGSAPSEGDRAFGIALDAGGNAYIAGETSASDFPTAVALQPVLNGPKDGFVTKLASSGSALIYSSYLGGEDWDSAFGIAVDGSGNAYLTGQTWSTTFPVVLPALQATKGTPPGISTVFVSKLNAAGSALVYSTYLGGSAEELAGGIAIDGAGNAYVTGTTQSTTFPKVAAFQPTFRPPYDAFVSKLNVAGTALVYSTYLGGTGSDFGSGITVDGSGNAYVTGSTDSSSFPIKAPAIQATNTASTGMTSFVTKLSAAGSTQGYSTYLGGSVQDSASAIAVDSGGNAYVTGFTASADFRAVAPMQSHGGAVDAFVSKVNPAGSALVFSTPLGGLADELGSGIAADSAGSAYVVGTSFSWNFPTPATAFQPFLSGDSDAFLVKLAASGSFPPIKPKTKSNAMLLLANTTSSASCGGVAHTSARTLSVTDVNGDGLACPGCGAGNTYAPTDHFDFIRLAFFGIHHDAAKTRNCGSDVRRTLVANYANLFQGTCAAGTCAGKPLRRLWRLNDTSGATDTLNGLLGTTTAQYCNVCPSGTCSVSSAQGTDFLENDPIRLTCEGTGKTGQQVCGNAAQGKLKSLGLVIPVFMPDLNDFSDLYPTNYCTAGANQLLPANAPAYTGLCPAGNPSFTGKCFSSVYRQTLPDGSTTTDANCIQYFQVGACPALVPATTDCRGANLWLRNSDGTIARDTTFPGAPASGRMITGAFFRTHATSGHSNGTGACNTAETPEQLISCLTGTADPCSVGISTRASVESPPPANVAGLAVKGILPDDPGVYYGDYPLVY
jgi:hypothetical protein